MSRRAPITFLAFFFPAVLFGQAEHVPVSNPVYEFLDRMHALGHAEGYSRAVLPLDRAEVTGYVRRIGGHSAELTGTERALLERYTDEFLAEADGTQRRVLLFSGEPFLESLGGVFSGKEKFLYAWANADRTSTFFMEALASLEYRAGFGDAGSSNVWLGQYGGRFRGTLSGFLGYGLHATNGVSIGDRDLALSDRTLAQNANFHDWKKDFFDVTEAHLGARWSWGSASIGNERLLVGTGHGHRAVIGDNAPPFDALRLNVHIGDFRFFWAHGWLLAERDTSEIDARPVYENKFIAMHRAEADIMGAVRFGVYESVVYSQRDIDPAYLNPVNFYKSAEHAGGDRDNPMLGFDLATLNLRSVELYGSWTIDDVDFSRWGTGWWANKFTWQAGAASHALLPNSELLIEYSRIEPFTYTHFYRNNEYANKGFALGFELPPNSDEWFLRLRHWIGADILAGVSYRYRRHGLNEYALDGTLVKNHGGEIYERYRFERDGTSAPFLAGPRETVHMAAGMLRWEPWRNIVAEFQYRYRRILSPSTGTTDHFAALLLEVAY